TVPAHNARNGVRRATWIAGQGRDPDCLSAAESHFTRAAWKVGPSERHRNPASGSAAVCSTTIEWHRRGRKAADVAPADGNASRRRTLQELPQDHGSDRHFTRELRRDRPLAN